MRKLAWIVLASWKQYVAEISTFSLSALHPTQRFDAWRESLGVIFEVNPEKVRNVDAFDAHVESFMLDGLVFNRAMSVAQTFNRPVSRYLTDALDHYMIQLFVTGDVTMRRGTREIRAKSGTLIALDLAETLDSVNADFELLNVFIPRRHLSGLLKSPDSLQGLTLDTHTGPGRLLADYMKSLFQTRASLSAIEETVASSVLIQLAAAAFNSTPVIAHDPPDWADHAIALKARHVIRKHLDNPDLTPSMVAAILGISRARLYRAFSEIGGVNETIRELRLRRCFADLVSPTYDALTVSEIAYRWGFADPSHFARAFRARFGMTASEARAQQAGSLTRTDSRSLLDRSYEAWIEAIG